jgi:hypothetical protein
VEREFRLAAGGRANDGDDRVRSIYQSFLSSIPL